MNRFREVNDDILKEWLDFRDQECFCELTKQDKEHKHEINRLWRYFKRNSLICCMIIFSTMWIIGQRSIIETAFVM